jgi:hypothetical protein
VEEGVYRLLLLSPPPLPLEASFEKVKLDRNSTSRYGMYYSCGDKDDIRAVWSLENNGWFQIQDSGSESVR